VAERPVTATRRDGPGLTLQLRVQPRAPRPHSWHTRGCIRVRISVLPVDDTTNARLIAFLAECFGMPKSRVTLLHGHGGKTKLARLLPALNPLSEFWPMAAR